MNFIKKAHENIFFSEENGNEKHTVEREILIQHHIT